MSTVTDYNVYGSFTQHTRVSNRAWRRGSLKTVSDFCGTLQISTRQRESKGQTDDIYGCARLYQVTLKDGVLSFKKRYYDKAHQSHTQIIGYRLTEITDQPGHYTGNYFMSESNFKSGFGGRTCTIELEVFDGDYTV